MSLPEEYGGAGLGLRELCLVTERTSAAGFPAAKLILSQGIVGPILIRHGTEEQRRRWLPAIADGAVEFCFALTEADVGSNAANLRTVAEPQGDHWHIGGEKAYITAVDEAAVMLVVAATPAVGGLTLFLVDNPAERLKFVRMPLDIALFENQYTVYFDELVVGPQDVVGEPGKGLAVLFDGLNPERLLTASQSVGLARWGLGLAAARGRERVVFDAPIGSHQAVAHPLAESWIQLEAAWPMVMTAARLHDEGRQCGLHTSAAKFAACDAGWLALDRALQTHAGSGFLADHHFVERLMVARLFKIAPVTREMTLNHISTEALGLPKSY